VVATAIGRYRIHKDDWFANHPPHVPRPAKEQPVTTEKTLYNTVVRAWSWPCVLVFVSEWLDKKVDPHPWGLVAMAALKFGDDASAACWLSRSEPLRYSTNWNVLEESAFQAVEARLQEAAKSNLSACSEVTSAP